MTKQEKKKFLRDLTASVLKTALERVERMPEEWDGIELRHYLADQYADQARYCVSGAPLGGKRRAAKYKNEMLVRNL